MVDLSKYRALFVSESREILANFQSELLRLEQKDAGQKAVDAMFRAAHSLKGMAASMGYELVTRLAHAMEDLTGDARGQGALGTAAVDLLLEGVDRLELLVDEVENSGDATGDTSDLVNRINAFRASRGEVAAPVVSVDPSGVTDGAKALAPQPQPPTSAPATAGGQGRVQIAVQFSLVCAAPQVRAFMLQREVARSYELIETVPSVDELKAGRFPERRLVLILRAESTDVDRVLKLARSFTDVESAELAAAARVEAPAPVEHDSADGPRTVRVRTAILDEFIDSVGELIRARDRLRQVAERVDEPELSEIADELVVLTKDLHDRVMAARMTPLALLTERLPRVVRDLARRRQREVELAIEGADIELDRALLDELHAAVLHVVRNAVDHGHDGSAARLVAGKPAAMSLVVRASRDRDHVLIEVEDDGGGIDARAVKERAVAAGTIDAARAELMSEDEALELICLPGLSTAAEVSDVSGRGVGMDAVRSTVERLGGDLQIRSRPGKGTCFTLRLPLTMAIIGVLLVESRGQIHAIPTSRVSFARDCGLDQVSQGGGERRMRVDDQLLPFFELSELLGLPDSSARQDGTVVLVEDGGNMAAVRVDRITGLQEVVVKPLGLPLAKLDFLAGAALLADGKPAFILDVGRLLRHEVVTA